MSLDFDSARLPNICLRPEHHEWRAQLRRFFEREVIPFAAQWDEDGHIPEELWPKSAAVGILGLGYPEEFGGLSEGIDIWYGIILPDHCEEFADAAERWGRPFSLGGYDRWSTRKLN